MNNKGFTLIELLVVISVIAILSTLTVVYLDTARMAARDARRVADVKQVQLALKMYYNDVGIYPTFVTINSSIANGGTNYLLRVPSNPTPRSDNGCPDQDYQYTQLESGQGYNFTFCLGDRTDDLDAGPRVATHNGILNCPTGWVAVPGSSVFNTNDFCVMKYEAKCAEDIDLTTGLTEPNVGRNTYDNLNVGCDSGNARTPVSVSSGYPIANVDQAKAQTLCESIGAHLMTNAEWMTIARNIEQIASNWNNREVGNAYIYKGNYDNDQGLDGTDENADCRNDDCKRTLTLSDGEVIWDLSGNVAEILSDICPTLCSTQPQRGCYNSDSGYIEWNDRSLDDYEREVAGPSDVAYTSSQNVGQYLGCKDAGWMFIRGGDYVNEGNERDGIFSLRLVYHPSEYSHSWGFRCVK